MVCLGHYLVYSSWQVGGWAVVQSLECMVSVLRGPQKSDLQPGPAGSLRDDACGGAEHWRMSSSHPAEKPLPPTMPSTTPY